MTLLTKRPKKPKRSNRFRSQKHCNHIRSFCCCHCGAENPIEVAHIRLGSGAGMGQKPHDYWAVPLCKGCHINQHSVGERTFWKHKNHEAVIAELIETSPARFEILAHMKEGKDYD